MSDSGTFLCSSAAGLLNMTRPGPVSPAAMTSPGSRFRPGQGKWCFPHATLPPPTNGGIPTTTVGYKTESEYADSGGAEGHPPGTMSPDNGAKEASSGVACSKALTYQCRMPPGSIFHVSHVSVLSVSDKIIPPKRRPWFCEKAVRQRGTDPWPNLKSTSIERLRRPAETFPVNRICREQTSVPTTRGPTTEQTTPKSKRQPRKCRTKNSIPPSTTPSQTTPPATCKPSPSTAPPPKHPQQHQAPTSPPTTTPHPPPTNPPPLPPPPLPPPARTPTAAPPPPPPHTTPSTRTSSRTNPRHQCPPREPPGRGRDTKR